MFYLVKGHELAQNRENEDELGSKIQELKFGDLKDDPLGSVPSILFWNDQQRHTVPQRKTGRPKIDL